jgi:L-lactate dehydrogenase (cytochrome)
VRPGEPSDIKALAGKMPALLDQGMSWAELDDVRSHWKGPLILKGVLHPEEALEAARRGVDAVLVSNHGGRQLDSAPAALDVLPMVAAVLGGRIPILLDGGVRRGADVVKALALGATACLIGRPTLWGVSVAGENGVAHVLETYRQEIDRAMALCGLRAIADITPDLLLGAFGIATPTPFQATNSRALP